MTIILVDLWETELTRFEDNSLECNMILKYNDRHFIYLDSNGEWMKFQEAYVIYVPRED